jgi:hypothetical protein
MSGIHIDYLVKGQNLRTVKTLREKDYNKYSLSVEDRNKNYLITKTIEPNEEFFSRMMLLKNYRTGELKEVKDRHIFVQYGEHITYSENEWEELLTYRIYQGSKSQLYTWAMYLVPKDAKEGERFYVKDVIDDIVAERFWDGIYRAQDGVGIWNGKNIEIDESLYEETFLVG